MYPLVIYTSYKTKAKSLLILPWSRVGEWAWPAGSPIPS